MAISFEVHRCPYFLCDYPAGECSGECGRPTKPRREEDQQTPTPNAQPAMWPLVMADMTERDKIGRKRYGTPLQPFNGRDSLRDAYEEALDLAVYLRTAMYERDHK